MPNLPLLKQLAEEQAALVAAAAVRVRGVRIDRRHALAGFAWQGELLVTAAEGLAGARRVLIEAPDGALPGTVLAVDPTTDVAILRIEGPSTGSGSPPLDAPAAAVPRAGEPAVALARRDGGLAVQWTSLELVGPAWTSRAGGAISQRLEFPGRFDSTFEGAAVFDVAGGLIGMAVPGPRRRPLAIPYATLARVVDAVARVGYLPRPFLGLRLQSLWLDGSARSRLGRGQRRVAVVAGVEPDSPAARAGVEFGDLLLSMDGEPLADAAAVAGRLGRSKPGECLSLETWRAGRSRSLSIEIGERPAP